jgi:hypothetical protein
MISDGLRRQWPFLQLSALADTPGMIPQRPPRPSRSQDEDEDKCEAVGKAVSFPR